MFLGGAIGLISLWTSTSLNYMDRTGDYRIRAFFKPKHLPWLAGYFGCFYGSIYLNLKGDKNLKNAVYLHNKSLRNGIN